MNLTSTGATGKQSRATAPMSSLCAALGLVTAMCAAAPALAAPIFGPNLASFAVLGAAGVTNVPTTTIGGNLGSSPNGATGAGYLFTFGSVQSNTGLAQQAQLELDAATVALNGMGPGTLLAADLTGTLLPGVYTVPAGVTNLSGDLILDGGGDSAAIWIFMFSSTLITSANSNVFVTNVGDGAKVGLYWTVASAATLNGASFAGNVLTYDLISSDGNLQMGCGRLLSATAQVTLIQDSISIGCAGFENSGGFDQGGDTGFGSDVVAGVPEPASLALLGLGLAAIGFGRRRKPSLHCVGAAAYPARG